MARTIGFALMLAIAAPAAAAAGQFAVTRTERLASADGTVFEATFGTVRVPERRPWRRGEPTVELAVVRLRRAGGTPAGSPPHVILAGGPGDSGIRLALGLARQGGAAVADLLDGDIVGIDQRGTGASRPSLAVSVPIDLPTAGPGSPDAWLPVLRDGARRALAELRARGIRPEAYTTVGSADDVDDVRRALEIPRVTLWGRSYGSHLALATLRRHEAHVARVVLVGPEGPDHTWKRPAAADRVLARLGERAGRPALAAELRAVLDRLRRAPVTVPVRQPAGGPPSTVVLGAFDIQWLVSQAMGDPRVLAMLPAAVDRMAAGDFAAIGALARARREKLAIDSAMPYLIDASGGASAARRAAIAADAPDSLLGDAIDFPGRHLAAAWGVDAGDAFRRPVVSDVPVLILAGDLDARTPVENGLEILATLARGRLVVVENAAHQFDLFGPAAIRATLRAFLRDAPLPEGRIVLPPPIAAR
jgi:pimeloyl-ACP methyl ester carboxylesterase